MPRSLHARIGLLLLGGLAPIMLPTASAAAQTERFMDAEREEVFEVEVNDAIEVANGRPSPYHDAVYPLHEPQWAGLATIGEIFHRFFSGVTPNATGVERPNADEHLIDEMEVPLAPRISYVLMGAVNDHMLTPLHFYQQFDGVHVIRYDVLRYEHGSPFRVALGVSPAYGSVTIITRHNGVTSDEQLPTSVVVGGAGGIDVWYAPLRLIQFHARAWAFPGVDVVNGGASGAEIVESVQFKWRLTEVFGWDPTWPIDLGLIALHVDRGEARSAVYQWSGDFRSPAVMREVWQLMAILELRVD